MSPCRLIVCEKTSHFAPAVRLELGQEPPQVVETRSLAGCEAALAESPESLIGVEATQTNLESVLEFIVQIGRRYPRSSVVALLSVDARGAHHLLAEAGAVGVFCSALEAGRLAQLAQRKLALATPLELAPREFVHKRLPWPAQATA